MLNKIQSIVINSLLGSLFTLWALTFTMLVFHLVTEGVDPNASFGYLG
jgi:hypothetical protein